jgi:hypothetical protein
MQRESRKIHIPDFIAMMCLESQRGSPSYNDLAARLESNFGISVSKQAIWKRVNAACTLFFQAVLAQIIKEKIMDRKDKVIMNNSMGFNRIIIQDSTVFKLPLSLFNIFRGVNNQHTSACSVRVQCVYDLLNGRFIDFSIDAYSRNDYDAAPDLDVKNGDLTLRDRGYMTGSEIERHMRIGADCIYRHRSKIAYLDPDTKEPVDILELLKKYQKLDIELLLNNPERTKIRIVAIPVNETIANARRMKAKREIKGRNPSKYLLELMSWTIFVTTIPKEKATYDQIAAMYRCRWRIEQIFKVWKSHLDFDNIHNVSYHQAIVLLTARLIVIALCTHELFFPYDKMIQNKKGKHLSMLKFFRYLKQNQEKLAIWMSALTYEPNELEKICETLSKYCTYDKRKRLNASIYEKWAFS